MGTGHVMQCLALAQAWQSLGGAVIFLTRLESRRLLARLRSEGMEVVPLSAEPGGADDAARAVKLAQKRNVSWVVVDGYQFGEDYQKAIKDANLRLLFLDDYGHARRYRADIVLDQNLGAQAGDYAARQPETRLLVGKRYVMLRREFLRWKNWRRKIPAVARKVLVTVGGGDGANTTTKVIAALDRLKLENLEVKVVVGHSNPHFESLKSAVRNKRHTFHLERSVPDISELMAWADAAVSGGGCTCRELAYMRVPSAVLTVAPNQRPAVKALVRHKAVLGLGPSHSCDSATMAERLLSFLSNQRLRLELARRGRTITDGLGARRVARLLLDGIQ